jgi:transposase
MLKVDQYDYIRQAHRLYGKKVKEISRETGHSKNTVKKALRQEYIGYHTRENQPYPALGSYIKIIDRWLSDDKERPSKQHHTAVRIYNRLKNEHGYAGAASTVRHYVRIARQQIGTGGRETFIPLDPPIGQEAEIDWGVCTAILDGETVTVKMFCMRSKYSGKPFVRLYPCERQQALFDGHIQAFSYFGGIFPVLIYDNLTTVVQKIMRGKERIHQKEYEKFQAYYNFTSRFCNPGQGHEKGGVEGLIGFARRNYLVPVPEAESLEKLNEKLLQECIAYGDHRISGREMTVNEQYEKEKGYLIKLPDTAFSNIQTAEGKTDKYSTIIIDKNRYSVPTEYSYLKVRVILCFDKVDVYYGTRKIATHKRLYNNNQWNLDPDHYLDLIYQRPQAFESARPMKQWRKSWPSCYEELLCRFREKQGCTKGTKDFINVLTLHRENNMDTVRAAIEKALLFNVSCSDSVSQIILNASASGETKLKPLENWPILPLPDLSKYSQIGCAV